MQDNPCSFVALRARKCGLLTTYLYYTISTVLPAESAHEVLRNVTGNSSDSRSQRERARETTMQTRALSEDWDREGGQGILPDTNSVSANASSKTHNAHRTKRYSFSHNCY